MSEISLADRVEMVGAHRADEETLGARRDLGIAQRAGIMSVPQLIEALHDPRYEVSIRQIACSLLAWLGEPSAVKAITTALEEAEDDGLVWEAAKALIRLRAAASAESLVRILRQNNPSKQSAAAYVLGWLAAPDSIPALIAAAVNLELEATVRGHAIEALGVMQARRAVPELIKLLSDESPEVRYWVAYSLGQIGDPLAIPPLEQMASHDSARLGAPHNKSLKEEALEALENIRILQKRKSR